MLILHRLSPHHSSAFQAKFCLFKSRVYSLEAVQKFLNTRRKSFISLNLIDKNGVAANFGTVEDV
jgi:hypothetical protein